MKRFLSLAMVFLLIFPNTAFGAGDEIIYGDYVADNFNNERIENTYIGRNDGREIITNVNFRDLSSSHWAKESVTRSGSLNLVKGYDRAFFPNDAVTNQEALAFIIRLLGMENDALEEAIRIRSEATEPERARDLWSIGYLSLARQLNIVTEGEYATLTITEKDAAASGELLGNAPASRERVAHWVVRGLSMLNPNSININPEIQSVLNFSDWDTIDIDYLKTVEAAVRAGIMKGDNGRFKPKASLTRAEMAQVLRNMDEIYYGLNGIEKKTGTVGAMRDAQEVETGSAVVWRKFYIRTAAGAAEIIQYELSLVDSSMPDRIRDAVVYKEGAVGGLNSLSEGDQIEYLVDRRTKEVYYVQVISAGLKETSSAGNLQSVDVKNGQITLLDPDTKKTKVYTMAQGVYGDDYIVIDQAKNSTGGLPIGSKVELKLIGNTVLGVSFIGTPVLIEELRGIVIENNTDFGYMTVVDNYGNLITKNYYADSMKVEKQQYYDLDDEIGYIDEVFPNFHYDPRDSFIEDIEPGDIVFMRFDPEDPDLIANISASTNYIARYGKITQITRDEGLSRYLVEYENKQTNWFDVADNIYVSKLGRPANSSQVAVGDWAKFLVNQAIIEPGYMMESVKEITVEGGEHFISTIIKGQLAGIEPIQNKLMIQNAQTLAKTGWSNHQNVQQISIANNDIEYYYNDQRISLDYAQRFLKRAEGDVYIALENSASGERAKMITFRNGRDELLPADTVITADGNGSFSILSNNGDIATDVGTIVRRYGRLVSSNNILPSDYTIVSLNGGNTAAVVDIGDAPAITGVNIARGRILSVDQGQNFKVQSMSVLSGNEWVYTPIQREFTIDYNTKFLDSEGIKDISGLRDYTADSAVDKVYNIIYDGSKATWLVDAPYSKQAVRGIVYESSGGTLKLRNAEHYDNTTGKWTPVSLLDATISVSVPQNAITVKNNAVTNNVAVGDSVRVLTDVLPEKIQSGIEVTGYFILVEK